MTNRFVNVTRLLNILHYHLVILWQGYGKACALIVVDVFIRLLPHRALASPNRVKMAHETNGPDSIRARTQDDLEFLDETYPDSGVEFVIVEGLFSPGLKREHSSRWCIPATLIFMDSPGED